MKLRAILFVPAALAFAQQNSYVNGATDPLPPISAAERVRWVIESTVLPTNILGNALGAAIGTGMDTPKELGPHWTGFEKRYFNSMTTGIVQNSIEAGLGAAWHEDPRYERVGTTRPFWGRVSHAGKYTFYARTSNGQGSLAYARFIAIPAANALSDTWRPPSELGAGPLTERVGLGFAGHFGGNLWDEFWPDFKKKVFRHDSNPFHGL
jgi:hypothetical protein